MKAEGLLFIMGRNLRDHDIHPNVCTICCLKKIENQQALDNEQMNMLIVRKSTALFLSPVCSLFLRITNNIVNENYNDVYPEKRSIRIVGCSFLYGWWVSGRTADLTVFTRCSSPRPACERRSCSGVGPSSGPRRRVPRPRWGRPS